MHVVGTTAELHVLGDRLTTSGERHDMVEL
jgi:hypothetical protein